MKPLHRIVTDELADTWMQPWGDNYLVSSYHSEGHRIFDTAFLDLP
jgi:hypothetical protein